MEDQIREIEVKDGLRLPFNVFPCKNPDTLPISFLYGPMVPLSSRLDYEPVFCFTCRSVINPYSEINYKNNSWCCVFCKKVNILPEHYRGLDSESLPFEFYDTTVEYVLSKDSISPPIYIFLIDICTFDFDRHDLLIEAVKTSFDLISDDSLICFILYGTNIKLLYFEGDNIDRGYIFSGKKVYEKELLLKLFNPTNDNSMNPNNSKTGYGSSYNTNYSSSINKGFGSTSNTNYSGSVNKGVHSSFSRFFVSKRDFDFSLLNISRDPFSVGNGMRPLRCTGSALSFASSMLDIPDVGSKILLFTQGPCTYGPGTICSLSLKESIRSHSDIIKGKSVYSKAAITYYTEIGTRMANQGTALDIIGATIEDIGIYEMKIISNLTGGIIIMAQDFDKKIYISSIIKNHKSEFRLNSKIKINTSPNLKFKAIVGQGISHQNIWRINSLYPSTNISVLLESINAKPDELGYVQIITTSQKERKLITRVTTLARTFSDQKDKIGIGYDQEAACVLQTRLYTFQNNFEEDIDLIRRIDRGLIRFVKKYATFNRDDVSSVTLPDSMSFYPNFMYFLRRSVVVQSEGNSPDETSYYRNIIGRECVTEAMTMIVPVLTSYHYAEGIQPMEMDSRSLRPDSILLLDAFSHVLIWKGEHVMEWIKQGLHLKEEYKAFNECLQECKRKAEEIVNKRLPTPQFTETHYEGSQERTLLARVNPSKQGATIATDDIDFETFYRCLCKIIVES